MSKIDLYKGDCQIKKERVLLEHRLYLLYRYITCKYLHLEPSLTLMNLNFSIQMNGHLGDSLSILPHYLTGNIEILNNGHYGQFNPHTKSIIEDLKKEIERIEYTVVEKGLFDEMH